MLTSVDSDGVRAPQPEHPGLVGTGELPVLIGR